MNELMIYAALKKSHSLAYRRKQGDHEHWGLHLKYWIYY